MGATFWEVYEYDGGGNPTLAFIAGAGDYAAEDKHNTTFFVSNETGWRDGAAMADTTLGKLDGDGAWVGPQFKEPFLVTLDGWYTAQSIEQAHASMRDARNVLGRKFRKGRLLAADSDGSRLYVDVVRGGQVIMKPITEVYGEWSMVFLVGDPIYLSEDVRTNTLRRSAVVEVGRAYTQGYPWAYQTANTGTSGAIITNDGDVPGHWRAEITGPCSRFSITDDASGNTLEATLNIGAGQTAILDSKTKTFRLAGRNVRHLLTGEWFMISPGDSTITFNPVGSTTNTRCVLTWPAEAWGG